MLGVHASEWEGMDPEAFAEVISGVLRSPPLHVHHRALLVNELVNVLRTHKGKQRIHRGEGGNILSHERDTKSNAAVRGFVTKHTLKHHCLLLVSVDSKCVACTSKYV